MSGKHLYYSKKSSLFLRVKLSVHAYSQ